MGLSFWAQISLIVIAAFAVLGLLILAVSAYLIYRQVRGLNEKARVLLSQAESALETVKETAVSIGERAEKVSGDVVTKAEHIADLSERVAERVAQRVDTTSAIVQEAISRPVINLASVRTGVHKGLEVWQELSKARGGNDK